MIYDDCHQWGHDNESRPCASALVPTCIAASKLTTCCPYPCTPAGRPNPADLMKNKEISLMMITSGGDEPDLRDGKDLRRLALGLQIPTVTTIAGARATALALQALKKGPLQATPLQDYFPDYKDESNYLMLG